jgi:MoaA/NifB/PqqE/SkfB family radical SAM enzyme
MYRWPIFLKKIEDELQTLSALIKYPFLKDALIDRLSRLMPGLAIETTNICNANCIFCAYQFQQRATGVMSMTLFRKVIDEYVQCGGGSIGLAPTVGDPFVDPHLIERIRYARSFAAITHIGVLSNMIALERIGIKALVQSGLSSLNVSMSGFDEEMYQRLYRSKMYKKVVQNVKAFAQANRESDEPIDFRVSLRVDRPLKEVVASYDYQDVANLIGADHIDVKFRYDDWAGRISQDALSGNMKLRKHSMLRRPRISACSEMFSGPMIYWDGKVGACGCRDVNASELIIGDSNIMHIAEIWFGEEIRKLREQFLTPAVPDICKKCTHYQNISIVLRPDRKEYLENIKPCPLSGKASDSNR